MHERWVNSQLCLRLNAQFRQYHMENGVENHNCFHAVQNLDKSV